MPVSPRTGKPMTHVEHMFDQCVLWQGNQWVAFRYNELLEDMLAMERRLIALEEATRVRGQGGCAQTDGASTADEAWGRAQ